MEPCQERLLVFPQAIRNVADLGLGEIIETFQYARLLLGSNVLFLYTPKFAPRGQKGRPLGVLTSGGVAAVDLRYSDATPAERRGSAFTV
jgi:hypothetical protein